MYHESEGPSLAETREERGAHHIRIYPAEGGFVVQHHKSAYDQSPERLTFTDAKELAAHVKAIASLPGRKVKPEADEVKNKYGRAEGAE
jgi:hypothetical protein